MLMPKRNKSWSYTYGGIWGARAKLACTSSMKTQLYCSNSSTGWINLGCYKAIIRDVRIPIKISINVCYNQMDNISADVHGCTTNININGYKSDQSYKHLTIVNYDCRIVLYLGDFAVSICVYTTINCYQKCL